METGITIIKQLVIMAIYCAIGFILHRTKLVSKEGCRAFSKLLLYVILPCVIINSFLREANPETTKSLLICSAVSVILLLMSMVLCRFAFRDEAVAEFSACFSNAGFFGIPLITMAYGNEPVFYIAPFVALLNILQWTYGQDRLLDKKQTSVKGIVLNPLVLSLVIGVILYALPISLPELLRKPVASLSSCNAPVAMIILGYYLEEISLTQLISGKSVWKVSLFRLVLIPILSTLIVACIPGISSAVKTSLIIAASAPVGINVAVYAELLGKDYQKAVAFICSSTVLCLVSLPLILLLTGKIIG